MSLGSDAPLMTLEDVSNYLKLKPSKVRSMIFRKEIPYMKIGRLVRFSRQDIDLWLRSVRAATGASSNFCDNHSHRSLTDRTNENHIAMMNGFPIHRSEQWKS
jgi:excisionase family DNA binding protein